MRQYVFPRGRVAALISVMAVAFLLIGAAGFAQEAGEAVQEGTIVLKPGAGNVIIFGAGAGGNIVLEVNEKAQPGKKPEKNPEKDGDAKADGDPDGDATDGPDGSEEKFEGVGEKIDDTAVALPRGIVRDSRLLRAFHLGRELFSQSRDEQAVRYLLPVLEEILEKQPRELMSEREKEPLREGREVAHRFLLSHPPLLRAYRARAEAVAKRLYEEGVSECDAEKLRKVAVSYFLTASGDDASYELGRLLLDRGDPRRARSAFLKALEHPDSNVPAGEVRMRLAYAELAVGRSEPARGLLAMARPSMGRTAAFAGLQALVDESAGADAGKSNPGLPWIGELKNNKPVTSAWRTNIPPPPPPKNVRIHYSQKTGMKPLDRWREADWLPTDRIALTGRGAVTTSGNRLVSLDPATGSVQWKHEHKPDGGGKTSSSTSAHIFNRMFYQLRLNGGENQSFLNHLGRATASAGNTVFRVWNPSSGSTNVFVGSTRRTAGASGGVLAAVGEDGKARWHIGRTMGKSVVKGLPPCPGVKVDGEIGDWKGKGDRVKFTVDGKETKGPGFSVACRLGWDEKGLLCLLEVRDDSLVEAAKEEELWAGDGVEVFFSANPHGRNWYQLLLSPGVTKEFPKPRSKVVDKRSRKTKTPEPETAARATTRGYTVEMRLPWEDLAIKDPEKTSGIRLQLYVNDQDKNGKPKRTASYHPALETVTNLYNSHPVRFTGPPEKESKPAGVQPLALDGVRFLAAPLVMDGQLVAPFASERDPSSLNVLACRPETGEEIWRAELPCPGLNPAGATRERPLATDGEAVYVPTGLGLLGKLDAFDGRVRWLTEYASTGSPWGQATMPMRGGVREQPDVDKLMMEWLEDEVFVEGGVVVVFPSDSPEFFGFDRDTGDLVYSAPKGEVRYAAGRRGATVYLAGSKLLKAVDLRTGETRWERKTPRSQARGLVLDEGVLLPVREGLALFDLETGKPLGKSAHQNWRKEPLGNLTLASGVLLSAGLGTLRAIEPSHIVLARYQDDAKDGKPVALARLGTLLRGLGHNKEARETLESAWKGVDKLNEEQVDRLKRDLFAVLEALIEKRADGWDSYLPRAVDCAPTPEDKVRVMMVYHNQLMATGEVAEGCELLARIIDSKTCLLAVSPDDKELKLSTTHWAAERLRVLGKDHPEARSAYRELVDGRIEKIDAKAPLKDLSKLVSLFPADDRVARRVFEHAEKHGLTGSTDAMLHAVSLDGRPEVAAEAHWRLASMYDERGWHALAATRWSALRDRHPDVRPDGAKETLGKLAAVALDTHAARPVRPRKARLADPPYRLLWKADYKSTPQIHGRTTGSGPFAENHVVGMLPGSTTKPVFACVNLQTGKKVWETRVPTGSSYHRAIHTGGGRRVESFGGIWCITHQKGFYALDILKGEVLWETDKDQREQLSTSAGTVFVTTTNDGQRSIVRALDRLTGEPLWRRQFSGKSGSVIVGAPVSFPFDGHLSMAVGSNRGAPGFQILRIDKRSGEVASEWKSKARVVSARPPDPEIVFATGGKVLRALSRATGDELWKFDVGSHASLQWLGQDLLSVRMHGGGNKRPWTLLRRDGSPVEGLDAALKGVDLSNSNPHAVADDVLQFSKYIRKDKVQELELTLVDLRDGISVKTRKFDTKTFRPLNIVTESGRLLMQSADRTRKQLMLLNLDNGKTEDVLKTTMDKSKGASAERIVANFVAGDFLVVRTSKRYYVYSGEAEKEPK